MPKDNKVPRKYTSCYSHQMYNHSRNQEEGRMGCSLTREECDANGGPDYCLRYRDAQMTLRKL